MGIDLPVFESPLILASLIAYYGMIILAVALGERKWRANMPERLTALAFALAPFIQAVAYGSTAERQYNDLDWVGIGIDAYLTGVVLLVALNADRKWPYLATAFMFYSLTSHIGRLAIYDWIGMSYAVANTLPTMLAVLALFLGAITNYRRRRIGEAPQDWVPYSKLGKAWATMRAWPQFLAEKGG